MADDGDHHPTRLPAQRELFAWAARPSTIATYEDGLRAYVIRYQDVELEQNAKPDELTDEGGPEQAVSIPDFGVLTLPFDLESYQALVRRSDLEEER